MLEDGPATPRAALRLVCFDVRGQELALPIDEVRETLPLQPITRVILTPPCLAGVFSLRGDIVPAIDLAILLGLPRTELGADSRIVVVEHPAGTAGLLVDRLRDLRVIGAAERRDDAPENAAAAAVAVALEPPPAHLAPEVAQLLRGVAATPTGTVRVLNAGAVITAEPLRALAGAAAPERIA